MNDGETSLEDDLRASMAEITARDADDGVVTDAPAIGEDAEPTAEQERDVTGKFAASEPTEDVEKSAPSEPKAEPESDDDAPITPDPYGLAPATWTAKAKEAWAAADPAIRAEVTKREKEAHVALTRFDGERQFGKQIQAVVAPYEEHIRALGGEPVQAVDYLIKTDYALRTAPPEQRKALFIKAAKDYGIDLSDAARDSNDWSPQSQYNDPRVDTALQRIHHLENEENARISRVKETEEQDVQRSIQDFASKPEHVYFDRVAPVMASLMESGQADSLEKAYDMAVYADPETRALHLSAANAETERKRNVDATAQAKAARNASPSVTGAPGMAVASSQSESSGSLEDDIRFAIRSASGRA
jgi:hypothetical protein